MKRFSLSGNVDLSAADLGDILTTGNSCETPFDLEIVACGLVSPLCLSFLDALNDRLQQAAEGRVPLGRLRLSVVNLCKLDSDSLREIWTNHYRERAVVDVTGDVALLSVTDNNNK